MICCPFAYMFAPLDFLLYFVVCLVNPDLLVGIDYEVGLVRRAGIYKLLIILRRRFVLLLKNLDNNSSGKVFLMDVAGFLRKGWCHDIPFQAARSRDRILWLVLLGGSVRTYIRGFPLAFLSMFVSPRCFWALTF